MKNRRLYSKRRRGFSNRQWTTYLAVLAVLVFGIFLISRHLSSKKNSPNLTPATTKDSGQASSQGSSAAGGQNSAVDTGGQVPQTASNNWKASQSGLITLKTPASGDKLSSGFTLSGSAKVSQVQYRLLDNKVGVISQGSLNVVNGNFSGNVSFKTADSSGRLDVFSYDNNGAEVNEVQIPVSY